MHTINHTTARLRFTLCVLAGLSLAGSAPAQTPREWTMLRSRMVEGEVAAAGIKHPAILAAMKATPRHEFVPADMRQYAYYDMAVAIGEHQTISPPFIVAYMTERLDPKPTDRVLEIGTGSGYQAALLSPLVKQVFTIEIVELLGRRAQERLTRLGYKNIEARIGDGFAGWPEQAPFDKIIVTCSPEKVPQPLIDQLREGGRIVIPLGERYQQTLCTLIKRDGKLTVEAREPTFFVPMTGQAEVLRGSLASDPVTKLTNGSFEDRLDGDRPSGWYYLRQARIDTVEVPQLRATTRPVTHVEAHHLTLENHVSGRGAQALQALGVDGRRVSELNVELRVRARKVSDGDLPEERAKLLISYFDEDRGPVGQEIVGPWKGTFDWQRKTARLKVPTEARIAIVAIGLLGATGELSCDDVEIGVASRRPAR